MTLPSWDSLPIRTKRSRKRLYGVLATEYSLTAWKSLPHNVKRSKKNLYNYIASEKNLEEYDELAKNNMRSTRLLYNYIKDNASGSKPTLTIKVKDGESNVSGATVTIGSTEKTTDANGEVTYSLDYDNYLVEVEKSGYLDYSENIKFRANHKTFTIPLEAEPSETGTVTVTCQDSNEDPIYLGTVFLCDENQMPSEQDDSMLVAYGTTVGETGVASLTLWDTSTHQPTQVTDIPFDDYYLFAVGEDANNNPVSYSGSLTVDGDETISITLTAPTPTGTGTVTVTCKDSENNLIEGADVRLWDTDTFTDPTHLVGAVYTGSDGTGTLKTIGEDYEPTETDAEIDFGTYYFNVEYAGDVSLYYTGQFVVDGDEEVTLTLTSE